MYGNLKALRLSLGMTQEEFGAQFGIKKTTYNGYEIGVSDPPAAFWRAVAERHKVSIDYLMGFTDDPHRVKYGGQTKVEASYYALDELSRRVVDAVMEIEAERFERDFLAATEPEERPTKVIPLFVAAAGPGEPVPDEPFGEWEVDADDPAQFAVKISGDSMEPELHDCDVVLCLKRRPQIGELAVIMVNGFLLVKQYIEDSFGNIYLRSINRDRRGLDVDILASGNDTVTGYGTVIHRKLQLVEE